MIGIIGAVFVIIIIGYIGYFQFHRQKVVLIEPEQFSMVSKTQNITFAAMNWLDE